MDQGAELKQKSIALIVPVKLDPMENGRLEGDGGNMFERLQRTRQSGMVLSTHLGIAMENLDRGLEDSVVQYVMAQFVITAFQSALPPRLLPGASRKIDPPPNPRR